ncbi:undecaprenyl/decaprenyl-phosphate alpha-N-acetylglucosaminyl 1-phosphate transferase [Candidatus Gracilibacteria bacterium]|nr:undecaprenyl/decaprenyl-phosphate alpha-N-acetylglucosaminyl 1-phosphate transferase [Candidatus Gracilibacteria bacterium]
MDRPEKYGLKRAPIPYYGGVAIYLAFLISLIIFVPFDVRVIGLFVGGTLIFLLGFFDDKFSLSPFLRLFVQFLAALILVFFGIGVLSIKLPFLGNIDFTSIKIAFSVFDFEMIVYLFGAIFTVVWVLAIINAMNFVDGISGLNSGVSAIAFFVIFLLSIHPGIHENPAGQFSVATIALILSALALAFFLFDFHPPKILMGDSGSTFFGFMVATLAIFSGGKVATAFLVLGLPILDMVWVVFRRILSGQSFWRGDLKHLHHRLLNAGLSEKMAVLFYLFVVAVFGFTAVSFVSADQKFFIIIGLFILMLLLGSALIFLPKIKEKRNSKVKGFFIFSFLVFVLNLEYKAHGFFKNLWEILFLT